MITITAKSFVKSGKKEEFLVLVKKMIRESRKEKGGLSYNLYKSIKDSNTFIIIDEWESKVAILLHNTSKHFTEIVPELGKLREGKPEINLYRLVID